MKQVVVNIKEGEYRFFMELIKSLDFDRYRKMRTKAIAEKISYVI